MATGIVATSAAFEMVGGGEHDAAEFIVVEVRWVSGRDDFFTNQREDLRRVIGVASVRGQCIEAASAQARWLKLPFDGDAQHMCGHADLFAPARAFVETTLGDSTVIRVTA